MKSSFLDEAILTMEAGKLWWKTQTQHLRPHPDASTESEALHLGFLSQRIDQKTQDGESLYLRAVPQESYITSISIWCPEELCTCVTHQGGDFGATAVKGQRSWSPYSSHRFTFSPLCPHTVAGSCCLCSQHSAWSSVHIQHLNWCSCQGLVGCMHLPGSYFQDTPEISQGHCSSNIPSQVGVTAREP